MWMKPIYFLSRNILGIVTEKMAKLPELYAIYFFVDGVLPRGCLEYGGREFKSRSLHLKPERPYFVRKGGFLVVERFLRPYRWPRHY